MPHTQDPRARPSFATVCARLEQALSEEGAASALAMADAGEAALPAEVRVKALQQVWARSV